MLINYGSCVLCLNNRDTIIDLRYVDFITITQTIGTSLTDLFVDYTIFGSQVNESGEYLFVYDGSNWLYNNQIVNLANYSISFTGTPVSGDTLKVAYEQTDDTVDLRYTNEAITEKEDLGKV